MDLNKRPVSTTPVRQLYPIKSRPVYPTGARPQQPEMPGGILWKHADGHLSADPQPLDTTKPTDH